MGILHETERWRGTHRCAWPNGDRSPHYSNCRYGLGTLWQCDECGQHYELRQSGANYLRWQSISRIKAGRKLKRLRAAEARDDER